MKVQLDKLGLDYEIFEAVEGRNLTKDEIEKFYDHDFLKDRKAYYSLGIVGCTLSHYFLYKKIVDEKIKSCLILEDDMILNTDLKSFLPDLNGHLEDGEVIMLFYQSRSPIRISNPISLSKKNGYGLYSAQDIKVLASTGGYLISYETARRMVESLLPINTGPDDWGKFYEKKILNKIRVVYPFVLQNSYAPTTINPLFKEGSLIKRLLNAFERYKIFPIHQIMKSRREKFLYTMQRIQIV